MPITNETEWREDGAPWHPAPWIGAIQALGSMHGHTVYVIGNEDHLSADPPEDHTPYSHTAWPGPQPYPNILACDIMPDGPVNLAILAEVLIAGKTSGEPGAQAIKYINYTDAEGNCHHISWEPGEAIEPSDDRGHIHISIRTDHINDTLSGWDPFTLAGHGTTSPAPQPAPSGGANYDMANFTNLTQGATGWQVNSLQAMLNAKGARDNGGAALVEDGIFGPRTEQSVRHFQAAHGLQVDGEAGPHTRTFLNVGHDL